jgi:2-polyprenyl-6-methoxyphenol hydroxylase-like FAD-dependent oxidoreductase
MLNTSCCVVGGGPAGVMLGFLLARRGVRVTVLEKYKDFFRDFRGDTVHPSTLELLHELGILENFLRLPHQELTTVRGVFGEFAFEAADFRRVQSHCKFVALMPQWDFLNFLTTQAKKFPNFDLRMEHEVVGLMWNGDRVTGVEVQTPEKRDAIEADLVVGCDGRHSTTRQKANLELREFGVPIDVLWFRISRHADDPDQLLGNINYGRALILLNRGEYFQAGLIIRKGSFDEIRDRGLEAFRGVIAQIAPYLEDRVHQINDWDQIKLLTVRINRLRRWSGPGVLCIGDAAHAMSPAWGVGVNLAIQDSVASANLLAEALLDGTINPKLLTKVQERRELPTFVTQQAQLQAHKLFARLFRNPGPAKAPWQLKVVVCIPGIQYLFGRMIGMGVRPEHIREAHVHRRASANPLLKIAYGLGVATEAITICFRRRAIAGSPQRIP